MCVLVNFFQREKAMDEKDIYIKITNKQTVSNEQTGLGAEPGTHEGRHKNNQQFAIHTEGGEGLEREQDCVVCCDCCPSI